MERPAAQTTVLPLDPLTFHLHKADHMTNIKRNNKNKSKRVLFSQSGEIIRVAWWSIVVIVLFIGSGNMQE